MPPDRGGPSASGAPFNPGTTILRVTPRKQPLPWGASLRNFGWELAARGSRQRRIWVSRNHRNGSMAAQSHASGCARRGQRGQRDASSSGIAGRDGSPQLGTRPCATLRRPAHTSASPEKPHPLQPPPEPGENAAGSPSHRAGRDLSPQPGISTCLQGTEPPPAPPLRPRPHSCRSLFCPRGTQTTGQGINSGSAGAPLAQRSPVASVSDTEANKPRGISAVEEPSCPDTPKQRSMAR